MFIPRSRGNEREHAAKTSFVARRRVPRSHARFCDAWLGPARQQSLAAAIAHHVAPGGEALLFSAVRTRSFNDQLNGVMLATAEPAHLEEALERLTGRAPHVSRPFELLRKAPGSTLTTPLHLHRWVPRAG